MHQSLERIRNELVNIVTTVKNTVQSDEPFNTAHGNWSFPALTKSDLVRKAEHLITLIDAYGKDELLANDALLVKYPPRLEYLKNNTIGQIWGSNCAPAVASYVFTLDALKETLEPALGTAEAEAQEATQTMKVLVKRIRALEATLADISPRSTNLDEKIRQIEEAHEAADLLPTDLENLREARTEIKSILDQSVRTRDAINGAFDHILNEKIKLDEQSALAEQILKRCDDAYRATTSEGLAAAFSERSKQLGLSIRYWVGGLALALVTGSYLGSNQLHALSDAIKTATAQTNGTLWIHLLLALMSIGAPVWFAWLATKQIGHRFRLAEDYGYKASISKAYEGYRREAEALARHDPEVQGRLFSSALTRLEELPLRLVEAESHGSPWHELAASDLIKNAVKSVPGFIDKVTELAKDGLATKVSVQNAKRRDKASAPDAAASEE